MNKTHFKKLTVACMAVLLLVSAVPAASAITYTTQKQPYNDNFYDVSKDDWFYDSVTEAYSLGIINGISGTQYAPDGTLDLAACIKLACCVYQLKNDGSITLGNGTKNWYDTYVDYALKNGIISEEYENYAAAASRAQTAVIFSRVLDKNETQINADAAVKKPFGDVTDPSLWYYSSAYKMYVCGIMTGDQNGNFNPEGKIKRSEIAAVVVRMLDTDRRVKVNNTESAAETDKSTDNSQPATGYNGEAWSMPLYAGGNDAIAFTGLTGFSFLYSDGACSGYSIECINDVVLSNESLSFIFRKDVGLTAMGIVRGWLNEAAYIDGVNTDTSSAERKAALDKRVSLYINGRKADIAALILNTTDGDAVYTLAFSDRYIKDAITSVVLLCGEIPDEFTKTAETAIANAASAPDAVYTDGTVTNSYAYTAAIEKIKSNSYTTLFEHETNRMMILYGCTVDRTTGDVSYALQFVYQDGSVQTVADQKLKDVRVNDSGTVLYYTITGADGSAIEYGVNIVGTSSGSTGNTATAPSDSTSAEKKDIQGTLAGLNITLSAKDTSIIALMEGENNVLFRGVYSTYATAFSIVQITPEKFFEYYTKHFSSNGYNRIFALKDGNYYAVIYDSSADERIEEAAERVISSVVTENTFDCVYEKYSEKDAPLTATPYTHLYLKELHGDYIVCDPFLWVLDDTKPNGFRMDNYMEADEEVKITADTEVWVLAMDYAPMLKTTYSQFANVWVSGTSWGIWCMEVDESTNTVTKLIQQYVP